MGHLYRQGGNAKWVPEETPATPRTTVVLSTYNGERYLREQLDSLATQTTPPDELVIWDDCSSDSTVSVARDFLREEGHEGWVLTPAASNKGWKRSFYDLILAARGEYIFPCDQDDVWAPEKIEVMTRVMDMCPDVDVLACSVEPLYEEGSRKTHAATDQGVDADFIRMQPLDEGAMYIGRPGCTYCVRKSFADDAAKYWDSAWPHDAILWRLAAAKGALALLDCRLVTFRRHGSNASVRTFVTRESRIEDVEYYLKMLEVIELYSAEHGVLDEDRRAFLDAERSWLMARRGYLRGARMRNFRAMLSGRRMYASLGGLMLDVVLGFRKKARA